MWISKWSEDEVKSDIKWRKRKHTPQGKKGTVDIEWCYKKLNCGYYVVLVKWGGLVGASYCAPDDALPHWNPQKSIDLAFSRRKIREDIEFSHKFQCVEDFVMIERAVLNGSVPHEVMKEIRTVHSCLTIKV